jgi:uncharacterized protein (TIGR01244 family)
LKAGNYWGGWVILSVWVHCNLRECSTLNIFANIVKANTYDNPIDNYGVMMSDIKKISEEFSAGGQPTPETLKQLADAGFKSVVNLRSADEAGVLVDEQQQAEALNLEYRQVQLQPTVADADLTAKVLAELEALPTPVYLHCGAGARANALALIALAKQQQLSLEAVVAKAEELGMNLEQPHLQEFLATL